MADGARRARKLAKLAARLAVEESAYNRLTEERASALAQREWPRREALLIVNSKSGPARDSLLRVQELVDTLRTFNIHVDIRVKLGKKEARRESRKAARAGCRLVIAAGGDGTVEAVASGLVGTRAALGVIPLGTYNNLAACLGIPTDMREACALIATAIPRPIDAGQIDARGSKPRFFFETATIGIGAALAAAGQAFEKGRWETVQQTLPLALTIPPVVTQIRLDGRRPEWTRTLLILVSNAPRAGAALRLAPRARMDDGLLDVTIFADMDQADAIARVPLLATGGLGRSNDPHIRATRCVALNVRSARPLPVAADAKLIGTTPVRVVVRPGAVLALVGPGYGLAYPTSASADELGAEVRRIGPTPAMLVDADHAEPPLARAAPQLALRVLDNALPRLQSALPPAITPAARLAAVPIAAAIALKLIPAVARALSRRLR